MISLYRRPLCLAFWAALVLCWAGAASNAQAARPPKAFFYYGGLSQWLALQYEANGSDAAGSGYRSQHLFKEKYHVGLSYSLLNPNFFTGSAALELGLRQHFTTGGGAGDGSGGGSILGYDFTGDLWKTRPYSAGFTLRSSQERINPVGQSSYNLDSDLHSVYLKLKNRLLPSSFSYVDSHTQTSGLRSDRETDRSLFSVQSLFTQRYLGDTRFELRREIQQTRFATRDDDIFLKRNTFNLSNRLDFKAAGSVSLFSRLGWRQEAGTRPLRSTYWGESLSYSPGQALDLALDYSRISQTSGSDTFAQQSLQRNDWRASLRHRLLKSISTQVEAWHSNEVNTQGEREFTQGRLALSYTKTLPEQSRLTLTAGRTLSLTEQQYTDPKAVFREEEVTVVDPDLPFYLDAPYIQIETIEITDADTGLLLEEGVDYTLIPSGSRIFLYVGDSPLIGAGSQLRILYRYVAEPTLKYRSDGLSLGSSLSLYNNKLTLYATFQQNEPEILSGEDFYSFDASESLILGFATKVPKLSTGGFYSLSTSGRERRESINAHVNLEKSAYRGNFTLRVQNVFTTTETESREDRAASDSASNYLSLQADYRTILLRQTKTKLYGKATNIHSDGRDRNIVTTGLRINYAIKKLTVDFDAYTRWRFIDSQSSREEALYLNFRRLF